MKDINFIAKKMKRLIELGVDMSNISFYIHPTSENFKTNEIINYHIVPVKTSTDDIPLFTLGDIEDMLPMNEMYWDNYKDKNGKMFYELHHNNGKEFIYENGKKVPFDRQVTWGKTRLECMLVMLEDFVINNINFNNM